jgi:hypothetical protein
MLIPLTLLGFSGSKVCIKIGTKKRKTKRKKQKENDHPMAWLALLLALMAVPAALLAAAMLRARIILAPGTRARRADAATAQTATVAFVHPDLGIGGAERLVVDAAVGLVQKGHEVVMYTSHHDPGHSFPETHDGTLTVKVYGDFLPRSILGKGHIMCATVRGIYLALMLLLREKAWDVMIVDQLSVPVPILLLSGARIIFYCHFPDLKLAAKGGVLKALYRMPFDYLEETTTLLAHKILVNSKFTMGVFLETFPSAKEPPEVLYPSINLGHYEPAPSRS